MVRTGVLFFLCLLISSSYGGNYDCYPSTTALPISGFDCRRDIVIVVDGTPYMKTKANIINEIKFIEYMLSNWTFGDNGVNVAFMSYGFTGQATQSQFYTTYEQCKNVLEGFIKNLDTLPTLLPTTLREIIREVYFTYGLDDDGKGVQLYAHRPGIEPRLIAFTSTTDIKDIESSKKYFDQLYNYNYDTVLATIFADVSLYSAITTLKTLNMEAFDPNKAANISETIATALCYHDIRFTPSPCPSTVQSTTPLPTSPLPSTTTSAIIPTSQTENPPTIGPTTGPTYGPTGGPTAGPTDGPLPSGTERQCKCNPAHLWLDLVVIIDNSASMTNEGLNTVAAHVLTLVGSMTIYNGTLPQSVRISIISVSNKATLVADFNTITDMDYLGNILFGIQWENITGINIQESLQMAGSLIGSQGEHRNNTRKVVLLYTSAYTVDGFDDPIPISRQLKASGVHIIGVQFIQRAEAPAITSLSSITSPNMTFANNATFNPMERDLLNITIEALCWINCFCINLWNENKNPFTTTPNYAQCLYMSDIDSGWLPGTLGCSAMSKESAMSFVKTYQKYEYLLNLLATITQNVIKLNLHLGIRYNSSLTSYQYLDGSLMTSNDYAPWDTRNHFPNPAKGSCVAAYQSSGLNVLLRNVDCYNYFARYACEMAPCDTENYCATLDLV